MKELTFKKQMIIGLAFYLLMFICSTAFESGVFNNIGWIVYGLLFVINPVVPKKAESVKGVRLWMRLAGGLCIIIGIVTRFGV